MKAEHRHQLEKNELAEKITEAWTGLSGTSPRANRAWTIALVVLLAGTAGILYSRYSRNINAAAWNQPEFADTPERLSEIIKSGPNTPQGLIARFHLTRWQCQDALTKLDAPSPDERVAAADTLEKTRTAYAELAKASSLPSTMLQEAMLQHARVEETLASVSKANDSAPRGSLTQALELYNKLSSQFPKTVAGEQATRRAIDLKAHQADIEKLYAELAKDQAKPPAPSPVPALPSP
ncbi:MAG: hypothetical protein K1X57_12910 [Gemmataceae bacterium]|nr:hypothetical protein [Gemmataceae bacterium]